MNDIVVLAVFLIVYLAMFLGRLPRPQLDRTGAALLGASALIALGEVTLDDAAAAIDVPTIALLFAFMVISAQLRLGGFFGFLTRRLADMPAGARRPFAGNLLIISSIANVIVVESAARDGIRISWGEHARLGLPVGLLSLAVTAALLLR